VTIQFSNNDEIARITLAHPPLNIIDFEMMSELSQALDEAKGSQTLLLTTSLAHFSTGVDVRIHTPDQAPEMLDRFHDVIRKIYHFPGLTLCAIRGYALGGAMELALCSDIILAEQTSIVGFPEITIGCFPPAAAVLLPKLIGRKANTLLFSGEPITALKALEIGLVDYLYEDSDSLDKTINQFGSMSNDAIRFLKSVIRKSFDFDFDKTLAESERIYKDELLKSPDVAEGVQAFLEKRKFVPLASSQQLEPRKKKRRANFD
jgi:cyclohexa-1,5-dienecarbonyl-CoA hydratase